MIVDSTRSRQPITYRELSLRDVVAPLFRRKRTVALTFLSVFFLVLLAAWSMGPTYTSHTEILVNRERQDPMLTPEATVQAAPSIPVTDQEINSEVELLLSRDVLEKVVAANKLDEEPSGWLSTKLHPNQTQIERTARAVRSLAKRLKVKPVPKTSLIDVEYSSSDPRVADSVLASLGDAYIQKHVAVHRPSGSFELFSDQADRYRAQLEQAEARLRDFARKYGSAPDLQRTDLAVQIATSIGTLHQAQQAAAADHERILKDREQMASLPQRSLTLQSMAPADKLLDDLHATLLAAQTKRISLGMKYDAGYPLVVEADREVAAVTAEIQEAEKTHYVNESTDRDSTYELVREDLARATTDEAAQKATVTATRQSIAQMQSTMAMLDQQALAQGDLIRDQHADETSYLLYLSKREQERTADALDMRRIGNVVIAVPPAIPVLPATSWPLITVVATVLAFVAGLLAAYLLDYLDSSFHTPDDVIEKLGIPVVIAIPKRKTA